MKAPTLAEERSKSDAMNLRLEHERDLLLWASRRRQPLVGSSRLRANGSWQLYRSRMCLQPIYMGGIRMKFPPVTDHRNRWAPDYAQAVQETEDLFGDLEEALEKLNQVASQYGGTPRKAILLTTNSVRSAHGVFERNVVE